MLLGRAGGHSSPTGFQGPQGWTTDTGVSETSHSSWIESEFCSSRAETLQSETDGPKSWGTSQGRLRRKRRAYGPGFSRDQNMKLPQACKQRRPQCGCGWFYKNWTVCDSAPAWLRQEFSWTTWCILSRHEARKESPALPLVTNSCALTNNLTGSEKSWQTSSEWHRGLLLSGFFLFFPALEGLLLPKSYRWVVSQM